MSRRSIRKFVAPSVTTVRAKVRPRKRKPARQILHRTFGTVRVVDLRVLESGVPVVDVVCRGGEAHTLRLDQSHFTSDISPLIETALAGRFESDSEPRPENLSHSIPAGDTEPELTDRESEDRANGSDLPVSHSAKTKLSKIANRSLAA